MEQLPIFVDLKDRKVVVAGGGAAAARKARLALSAGARVELIAQLTEEDIDELAARPNMRVRRGRVGADDIADAHLVFAASEVEAEDAAVAEIGRASCRERV